MSRIAPRAKDPQNPKTFKLTAEERERILQRIKAIMESEPDSYRKIAVDFNITTSRVCQLKRELETKLETLKRNL